MVSRVQLFTSYSSTERWKRSGRSNEGLSRARSKSAPAGSGSLPHLLLVAFVARLVSAPSRLLLYQPTGSTSMADFPELQDDQVRDRTRK